MNGHSILQDRGCAVDLNDYSSPALSRITDPPPRQRRPLTRILLLDRVALDTGDRQIVLRNRKAAALMAYLALTPGMRETRERLVGLLWSETEPAKARGSLRQLLYWLRDTLDRKDVKGLTIDKLYVSLDPAAFATDLETTLKTIDYDHPAELTFNELCITDAILCGYDDVSPSFHSWLTVTREKIRRQMIARLEGRLSETRCTIEMTKRIARALLQMDPTHEVACQHLMRAHVASGSTAGALAAYKQLWDHLEQAFDIEPSPVTQDLVVAIRCGTYRHLTARFDLPHLIPEPNSEEFGRTVLLAMKVVVAWIARADVGCMFEPSSS